MPERDDLDLDLGPFAAALMSPAAPKEGQTSAGSYSDWAYASLVRKQRKLIDLATRILQRKEDEIHRRDRGSTSDADARLSELEITLADLRQENEELRSLVERESMNANSRSSLERVMLVAILKAYEAIPGTTTRAESIATRLASDADLLGLAVDPKTVRKYSEQAARHHKLLD